VFSISRDHFGGSNGALGDVLLHEDSSSRATLPIDDFDVNVEGLTSSINGFIEGEAAEAQDAGTIAVRSFSGPLAFKFGMLISSQCHCETLRQGCYLQTI